jgi:hypothetical protein
VLETGMSHSREKLGRVTVERREGFA